MFCLSLASSSVLFLSWLRWSLGRGNFSCHSSWFAQTYPFPPFSSSCCCLKPACVFCLCLSCPPLLASGSLSSFSLYFQCSEQSAVHSRELDYFFSHSLDTGISLKPFWRVKWRYQRYALWGKSSCGVEYGVEGQLLKARVSCKTVMVQTIASPLVEVAVPYLTQGSIGKYLETFSVVIAREGTMASSG